MSPERVCTSIRGTGSFVWFTSTSPFWPSMVSESLMSVSRMSLVCVFRNTGPARFVPVSVDSPSVISPGTFSMRISVTLLMKRTGLAILRSVVSPE